MSAGEYVAAFLDAAELPAVLLVLGVLWALVRLVELVAGLLWPKRRPAGELDTEQIVESIERLVDIAENLREFASDAADERQSIRQAAEHLVDTVDRVDEHGRRTADAVEQLVPAATL